MLKEKIRPYAPYLGILGILLILLVYTQYRQRKVEVSIDPVFDFKPEKVTAFTVTKENQSVVIVRADSAWAFAAPDTGRPEKFRMDQFVKEVLGAQHEGPVVRDTVLFEKYGLTASKATVLEVRGEGGVLSRIYIGQTASDATSEYLRYEDDDRIYPVRGRLSYRLSATASWWR